MDITENDVIGFEALYESMMKTKNGVLWKDSVAAFYHRGVARTDILAEQLQNRTYKASPPKHFTITSPKPREIASIAYRDRIYQRSLNDNIVYPIMTNGFIYDNWACQTGKGTDQARNRLKEFLRKHYRKHGCEGYVAQLDIHGYYPNMRHDIAEENFKKNLPEWAFRRVQCIMREQYDGEVGYNPGSQLIQIAGISLLNDLDHFIKERLHVKFYLRYMDDLILIHESIDKLKHCQNEIIKKLSQIGFTVNLKKTDIYPLKNGITFLGFKYFLSDTGKVYMIVDPARVKAARKKYKRLVAKAKRGGIERESVDQSFNTWIDHISKGNSKKLIRRLTDYYNNLWKDDSSEDYQEQHDTI